MIVNRRGQNPAGKKNKRRVSLKLKALALFLLLCALGGLAYSAVRSRLFELRQVVFVGNSHLAEGELVGLTGLKRGTNMLEISSREVAERVYSSPWIREASVRKEYLHRVVVKVVEAEPAAILRRGADMYLIDREGALLERLADGKEYFLPVIVDSGGKGAFREALLLAGVIKEAGIAKEKGEVEISGYEGGAHGIRMKIDGMVVKLGEGQYPEKLAKLFEVGDEIGRRNLKVEYVDLRFANRVVVKPLSEVVR